MVSDGSGSYPGPLHSTSGHRLPRSCRSGGTSFASSDSQPATAGIGAAETGCTGGAEVACGVAAGSSVPAPAPTPATKSRISRHGSRGDTFGVTTVRPGGSSARSGPPPESAVTTAARKMPVRVCAPRPSAMRPWRARTGSVRPSPPGRSRDLVSQSTACPESFWKEGIFFDDIECASQHPTDVLRLRRNAAAAPAYTSGAGLTTSTSARRLGKASLPCGGLRLAQKAGRASGGRSLHNLRALLAATTSSSSNVRVGLPHSLQTLSGLSASPP
jgi:hypothetical protein